jgi:hypothetical protein
MPILDYNYCFKKSLIQENINNINNNKVDLKKCSKNCCNIQWLENTELIGDNNGILDQNYLPSNFSCNFGDNSGCVCLTKNDFNNLSDHYNNIIS